jgi:hypothetical protein
LATDHPMKRARVCDERMKLNKMQKRVLTRRGTNATPTRRNLWAAALIRFGSVVWGNFNARGRAELETQYSSKDHRFLPQIARLGRRAAARIILSEAKNPGRAGGAPSVAKAPFRMTRAEGFHRVTGGGKSEAQKKIHGAAASAAERCDFCEKDSLLPVCKSWREHRPVYGPSLGILVVRKFSAARRRWGSTARFSFFGRCPSIDRATSRQCRLCSHEEMQPLCRSGSCEETPRI